MLTVNLEHRIADADRLRFSRDLAEYKALCFGLVPRTAQTVLDLGSATGEDALALAECLGPECQVIGVELDAGLVEEARRRARNVALDVQFVVGDCCALQFDTATFDVVRADRVLGTLPRRAFAVAESARVLRPGGMLIIHDESTELENLLLDAGLTVLALVGVPYGGEATPTWLATKLKANDDAGV